MVANLPPGVIWRMPLSGVYPLVSKKSVGFHFRNDKESHIFQRQKPLILQHDVDTDVSLTYLSSLLINQQTVLLY